MTVNRFLGVPRAAQIIPLAQTHQLQRQRNRWIPRALFFAIVVAGAMGLVLFELPILMDAYTIQN